MEQIVKVNKRIYKNGFIEMQNEIDRRMHRTTQQLFYKYFKENRLKGPNALKPIPGNYYWKDVIKIYLHWLLYHPNLRFYIKWGLPKTSCSDILDYVEIKMNGFSSKWLHFKTYEERIAYAQEYFQYPWNKVTIMLDGTHTPCFVYPTRNESKSDYYSFKLKNSALNTQVAILANGWICWVSDESGPAAIRNDPAMMNDHIMSYIFNLSNNDITIANGVYFAFDRYNFLVPHRKPVKSDLKPEQVLENEKHTEVRSKIERSFGLVKNRFDILTHQFKFEKSRFNNIFKMICALNNIEIHYKENGINEVAIIPSWFQYEIDNEFDNEEVNIIVQEELIEDSDLLN